MSPIIGVDVGGTFTDVVVVGGDGLVSSKVPTTVDQSEGVSEAVSGIEADVFLHGTTAATNTLLEERGARVALIVDSGYEDLLEIARQDRPSLYDAGADRPTPLVPRGSRYTDPDDLGDEDIVAVSLLESYLDPRAEREMANRIDRPYVLSSDVSPEFREYERMATTVLSAYLTPSVGDYLARLDGSLSSPTRLVMTSSGGLVPFGDASAMAGRLVLSGPAGGVVAAAAVGHHHGYDSVISFDMGGTSTDVCRITGGVPSVATSHEVEGRVNRVPSVPIRTIGAGGGSIAWVDHGGALRVGPRSAGAEPGPAVYGHGGSDLTVTDANVLAGHLPADLELGGSLQLVLAAGQAAADRLARDAGLEVERVVAGVLEVVDAHMERALAAVSVEEGVDPRDSALVAFGGAGGLHATRLARRLAIQTVLVPPHSGVFSALGLLLATPRADAARTVMLEQGNDALFASYQQLENDAVGSFRAMFGGVPSTTSLGADMRYVGQSHELEVAAGVDWGEIGDRFHNAHRARFGFARVDQPIEIVNIRATATGRPPLDWSAIPTLSSTTPIGREGVWQRASLPPGFTLAGPGVVVEDNSATLLEPGDRLSVLDDGTLQIELD